MWVSATKSGHFGRIELNSCRRCKIHPLTYNLEHIYCFIYSLSLVLRANLAPPTTQIFPFFKIYNLALIVGNIIALFTFIEDFVPR